MPAAAPHPAFLGVLVSPCRSSGFCGRHFHKLSLLPGPSFLFLLNPQPLLLMCFSASSIVFSFSTLFTVCVPNLSVSLHSAGWSLQIFVSRAENNVSFTKTFVNESWINEWLKANKPEMACLLPHPSYYYILEFFVKCLVMLYFYPRRRSVCSQLNHLYIPISTCKPSTTFISHTGTSQNSSSSYPLHHHGAPESICS